MNIDYVSHLAAQSGGILYAMAVLFLIALAVIVERSWYLNRILARGEVLARDLAALGHLDGAAVDNLMARAGGCPQARVLAVAARHADVTDPDRLGELLEEAILAEVPAIDRRMWMLDTVVTLAPLLGLLGTIIGMFNAFQVLGRPGSPPTAVTGGIAEALVATACGLFIAILGLVFFNGLNTSIRLAVHQLERIKVMVVNRRANPRAVERESGARDGVVLSGRPVLAGALGEG
jgi:biopolymer transport protein ExbB